MISWPKRELDSNEHLDKVSFMDKSFIAFYLTQCHKNAFHKQALPFCLFHFTNRVIYLGFGKISQSNLSFGLLTPKKSNLTTCNLQLITYHFRSKNVIFNYLIYLINNKIHMIWMYYLNI